MQEPLVVFSLAILINQKGTYFFCHNHSARIVESGNAKFVENGQISGSEESRKVDIQGKHAEVPTSDVSFSSCYSFCCIMVTQHSNATNQYSKPTK